MRPTPAGWDELVAQSADIAIKVEVEGTEIEISDGSVTLDQKAEIRGRCELTIRDTSLIPTSPSDLLAPFGNEVTISRGIGDELIQLGIFRIEDFTVSDSGDDFAMQVVGQDRSSLFQDASFEEPFEIAASTNFATAIEDTLAAVGSFETSFASTTVVTPTILVVEEGDDRWKFCQDLARAIGGELYFDGDGILVLRPISEGASVYTIAEGEDGVLLTVEDDQTRQGSFNRVIVTGENIGEAAVRGVATDDDPASPTYYFGPFGRVPRFYANPYILTTTQAADAANGILTRGHGIVQSVSFGAVVNPALEAGDVVTITREAANVDQTNILDSISIPLTPEGTMSGRTRATQN